MKKTYKSPMIDFTEITVISLCGIINSGGIYDGGDIDTKERHDSDEYNDYMNESNDFDWNKGIW